VIVVSASAEDAKRKVGFMLKLVGTNVVLFNELDLLGRAFEISLSHDITVYDALYIALAEGEGPPAEPGRQAAGGG